MYNNNFQIDYDCAGFCAVCHTEIAEFKGSFEIAPGIFKPAIEKLKGNYRNQLVYLSDGSQMNVSLCENCVNLTPDTSRILMKNVVNGWKKEIEVMEAYVDAKCDLCVTDVPSMNWSDDTKLELAKGVSDGARN